MMASFRFSRVSSSVSLRKPRALSQRILKVDGNAVLLEQVRKGFVGQFLKCRHPVAPKLGELVERVLVGGDQFAQTVTTPGRRADVNK
jgi:hypothetical protein